MGSCEVPLQLWARSVQPCSILLVAHKHQDKLSIDCIFCYIQVRVGDNCTTDWVAIPCATTSTDGGAVQFPGSSPSMYNVKPF